MLAVTEKEIKPTSLNGGAVPLLRISLRVKDGKIAVDEVYRTYGSKPSGEIKLEEEVPASIIGHWLEVASREGKTIYRQYVQKNLPFNMENVDSRLQRAYALEKYRILAPDLPEGNLLTLYEQSLPSPNSKAPERKIRLQLGLERVQTKMFVN